MRLTRAQGLVKLDFDKSYPDVERIRMLLQRAGYQPQTAEIGASPSGMGWHVVIDVKPRPRHPMEVVALQAILGSDPYREAMQMHRARAFPYAPVWMRNAWNVLYLPHRLRQRHIQLREK